MRPGRLLNMASSLVAWFCARILAVSWDCAVTVGTLMFCIGGYTLALFLLPVAVIYHFISLVRSTDVTERRVLTPAERRARRRECLRADRAEKDARHRRARRLRAVRALDVRVLVGIRCVSIIVYVTLAFCVAAILAAIGSLLVMVSVVYLYLLFGRAVWVCTRKSVEEESGPEVCENIPCTGCALCMSSPCLGITKVADYFCYVRGGGYSDALEISSNDGSDAAGQQNVNDVWSLLDYDNFSVLGRALGSGFGEEPYPRTRRRCRVYRCGNLRRRDVRAPQYMGCPECSRWFFVLCGCAYTCVRGNKHEC